MQSWRVPIRLIAERELDLRGSSRLVRGAVRLCLSGAHRRGWSTHPVRGRPGHDVRLWSSRGRKAWSDGVGGRGYGHRRTGLVRVARGMRSSLVRSHRPWVMRSGTPHLPASPRSAPQFSSSRSRCSPLGPGPAVGRADHHPSCVRRVGSALRSGCGRQRTIRRYG